MGFLQSRNTWIIPSAYSRLVSGVNPHPMTMTASTPGSFASVRVARKKISRSKCAVRLTSIGLFRLVPEDGINRASAAVVSGKRLARANPCRSQASAAETARPPGPERMATRLPSVFGNMAKPIKASTMSSNPTTGMAPVCCRTPCQIPGAPARAPV
jgi:hypothetical protein